MFDPRSIKPGTKNIIIGSTGAGKSTVLKSILYFKRHVPMVVVVCPTELDQGFFSEFTASAYHYYSWDRKRMTELLAAQSKNIRADGKQKLPSNEMILIMDDCMAENMTLEKDPVCRKLFMNGRHWNITVFVLVQYIKSIGPSLRGQISNVFAFGTKNRADRKKFYEEYFGIYTTFKAFEKAFFQITENRKCIVATLSEPSNDLEKNIYYFASIPNLKPFKMGSDMYWQMHRDYLREKQKDTHTITLSRD